MNRTHTTSRRIILLIASIGPLGYFPTSGTVTVAVIGIPLMYWMLSWSITHRIIVTLLVIAVSVWLHDMGDRLLSEKDSRKLVWDEIAGFMVAVTLLVEFTWLLALWAVVIERIIDIVKVPPARWIERKWPGGWGVVGDDVVAGIYAYILLMVLIRFMPGLVGMNPS